MDLKFINKIHRIFKIYMQNMEHNKYSVDVFQQGKSE